MPRVARTLFLVIVLLASASFAAAPTRLFLQQVGAHSAIVKWRGDAGDVCFSTKLADLSKRHWPRCVPGAATAGDHYEALLTGLSPEQTFYYSVAGQIDASQHFRTAPNSNKAPQDGNTHIWIVGDSGTRTEDGHAGEAEAVRDGFAAYNAANGDEPVDLFLMLGDNAYDRGTDAQYQGAVFDLYRETLKQAPVWSTIGNHEMGVGDLELFGIFDAGGLSISADPDSYSDADPNTPDTGMPYFDIFTLPERGEVGGVPSGTEQYYSFDSGHVHVVSLDSQLSARDAQQREAMKSWLIADLAANRRDWTVVIFHHPPYSRGTHDSDSTALLLLVRFTNGIDLPMRDMRREFTPIFDAHGVDVVYSGHSHNYERSYYLRGHTGDARTFDAATHAEPDASGQPGLGQGSQPYTQITSSGYDDRSVYTVAGNSGKAEEPNVAITNRPLTHPAMIPQPADPLGRRGLVLKGSVVLDASADALRARMVDENGAVLDEFTITR
jgi:hypothetical protein